MNNPAFNPVESLEIVSESQKHNTVVNDAKDIVKQHVVQQVIFQYVDQVGSKGKKDQSTRVENEERRVKPEHRKTMYLSLRKILHELVKVNYGVADDEKGGNNFIVRADRQWLYEENVVNANNEIQHCAKNEKGLVSSAGLVVVKPSYN